MFRAPAPGYEHRHGNLSNLVVFLYHAKRPNLRFFSIDESSSQLNSHMVRNLNTHCTPCSIGLHGISANEIYLGYSKGRGNIESPIECCSHMLRDRQAPMILDQLHEADWKIRQRHCTEVTV